MKKTVTILVLLAASVCISCSSSTHFPVPGESQIAGDAVYTEYLAIADAYSDLGKYDKAASYYALAMKNKKVYWAAYYKLGRTYALAKKWDDAENIYSKLLKRDPKNVNLRLSLAYIKAMAGKIDDSMMMYKILLEEEPDNEDVLVNYITVLLAQGRAELAESQLAVLKEKFPDNTSISALTKKISDALQDDGSVPAGDPPPEVPAKSD
jgi:Putative Zn-dependent protease, contains TPR repeats